VKRYGMAIVAVGVLAVLGVTLRPCNELAPDEGREARVQAASSANVPLPVNFRQNRPRHWRYMMLSPGR